MIVTANHIVEDDNINYNIIYNWKEYKAEVFFRNKEKDIANLLIKSQNNIDIIPLQISEDINNLEHIYSFWVDIENLEIIYNTWIIINKKSKLENMSNLLEISNNIKPWFSWWPIINTSWKVIWINYAISSSKNYWIILP